MSYPILRVHRDKIRENGEIIIRESAKNGISLWGVSKGISAFTEIAETFCDAGFKVIADSRMENIRRMKEKLPDAEYALIRIPMLSELEEVAELCDYCLISETVTLKALSDICERSARKVKAVLMFDMGDLREGFWHTEIDSLAQELCSLSPYLKISGVGANFSCASGVLPTTENLTELSSYAERLEKKLGYHLEIISGGGTCSFHQLLHGRLPRTINSLRIGEALLLGYDTAFCDNFPMLNHDTMELEAELVEVRTKPTLPIGLIGRDAFGNVPVFEDRGNRRRGILALGKQDVCIEGLTPLEEGVSIITASSDHLLVDIEDATADYKVGDILRFKLDYTAMLSASTSPYVTKVFEGK